MSFRFLLFLASAGAEASVQVQGMAIGLPVLVSDPSRNFDDGGEVPAIPDQP